MVDKTSEKKNRSWFAFNNNMNNSFWLYSCEKLTGTGADPGIFDLGFPKCGSERTVELFCGKLRVAQSVNARRRWRGKYCFASRGEHIIEGYPKTIIFLNIPGI